MRSNAQPIIGFVFIILSNLTLYLVLKLSGKIPGPGWWPWNEIDFYVIKTLSLLQQAIPLFILIFISLPLLYFKKRWDRKKEEETEEYERYYRRQDEKEVHLLTRLKKIENELMKLNETIFQMNKIPEEINESAIQDFL